jgi:hypothetical protein
MRRILSSLLLFAALSAFADSARAQYKNMQFGFEAGILFYGDDARVPVEDLGPLLGLRGAYKASDHWWFTSRAALSFREQTGFTDQTVFILHLVPVDVRYYFLTDRFRPFLGLTNHFQFFLNGNAGNVFWGPGGTVGLEAKVRKDTFFGLQTDLVYTIGDGEFPVISTTAQLNFFF